MGLYLVRRHDREPDRIRGQLPPDRVHRCVERRLYCLHRHHVHGHRHRPGLHHLAQESCPRRRHSHRHLHAAARHGRNQGSHHVVHRLQDPGPDSRHLRRRDEPRKFSPRRPFFLWRCMSWQDSSSLTHKQALLSSINGYYFNLRTRSLNNVMFQFIMMPCPLLLAYVMDTSYIKSRRTRGMIGAVIVGTICLATNAGLAAWITKNDVNRQTHTPPGVDWSDSGFGAGFVLYLLSGIIYATYQIVVQWTLGAMSNDPVQCSRLAGLFKGTTSLGMCISFVLDSKNVSYIDQLIVQFTLYAVGLVFLLGIIWFCVKDTNYFLEENVIVPHRWEERARIEGLVAEEQIEREHQKEMLAQRGIAVDSKTVGEVIEKGIMP
ncbi:hypothetical protein CLAIMM_06125 isoform 2 [Cladophialophora immunda]|nr:hypothetical protein CLAIMM_06125 isoform 2 [Cladophialophora immunda]